MCRAGIILLISQSGNIMLTSFTPQPAAGPATIDLFAMTPTRRSAAPSKVRLATSLAPEATRIRDIASRFLVAHLLLNNARGQKVTLAELGEELAALIPERTSRGKVTPLDASTIHRVETAKQEPDSAVVEAMALVCQRAGVDIDPGWLLFGDATRAPRPMSDLIEVAHLLRP